MSPLSIIQSRYIFMYFQQGNTSVNSPSYNLCFYCFISESTTFLWTWTIIYTVSLSTVFFYLTKHKTSVINLSAYQLYINQLCVTKNKICIPSLFHSSWVKTHKNYISLFATSSNYLYNVLKIPVSKLWTERVMFSTKGLYLRDEIISRSLKFPFSI